MRIVDLETKSYANSSRPATISRRTESRIEELTNQLNQANKDKNVNRPVIRDVKFPSVELDRQRIRMEEERISYESQIDSLRQQMDVMVNSVRIPPLFTTDSLFQQTEGSELRAAGRRAERDAADYKQKALK